MEPRAIEAYDLPERVASYDAQMDRMHPNRAVMVRVALEILPFPRASEPRALDLGVGTGYFTRRFLERFPGSRVMALDGARAMVEMARARLQTLADRVDFRIGHFRKLGELGVAPSTFDVVFSSYALHHLDPADKEAVIRQAVQMLRPGGWFVNADLVAVASPAVDERIQQLRAEGIVARSGGVDERFRDVESTRRYLEAMQANEGDQPLTMAEDLELLRRAGLPGAAALWLEYREMVSGGAKGSG